MSTNSHNKHDACPTGDRLRGRDPRPSYIWAMSVLMAVVVFTYCQARRQWRMLSVFVNVEL